MLVYLLIIVFIALAIGLIAFFIKDDRGPKKPTSALWLAFFFGAIGAVAAAYLEKALIPIHNITAGSPLTTMWLSFLVIALIEEGVKFLPLAGYIYPKRFFKDHTDGIIYFALAGLGFGLPENILYTLDYGSKAGLGRLILTPFFHAALTGMIGFYLVRAKLNKKHPLSITPVFLAAILLHSLYDFGLNSGTNLFNFISVIITLALTANLFYLFFKAKDLDEDMGLAAVGHNSFCRACGHGNPKHYLYCTHCGQRA